MSRIFETTQFDTPEIIELRHDINASGGGLDATVRRHRQLERQRYAEYNQLLVAQRPEYPLDDHVRGLESIALMIRDDIDYGDHLGCARKQDNLTGRTLPASVGFSSRACRVNLYAHAPHAAGSSSRLWEFSEHELAAFRQLLKNLSLGVFSSWTHDDGVAFIVADARV